jgi:hypothetical protein
MAVTVAPLTTTVMGAVESGHAGVASGINNAVARVAGLLAIAVFGVVLVRSFDAQIRPRLDELTLSAPASTAIERELAKMAGAGIDALTEVPASMRTGVRQAIDEAFVSAFRRVLLCAAALALAGAAVGLSLR